MKNNIILNYLNKVLENMPKAWLNLTTHRLDIYDEKLAKSQFLEEFEILFNENNSEARKNKITILLVEDNIELKTWMVSFLSKRFNCITAINGKKGISIARTMNPDIIAD